MSRINQKKFISELLNAIDVTNAFLKQIGISDFIVHKDPKIFCATYTLKFDSISKVAFDKLKILLNDLDYCTTTDDVCVNYLKEICFTFAIVRKQFYPA